MKVERSLKEAKKVSVNACDVIVDGKAPKFVTPDEKRKAFDFEK